MPTLSLRLPGIRSCRSVVLDGQLNPDFYPVFTALRRQLARSPGGAAVCVYHRGECVVDMWGGARDETGQPWRRETMAPSFSTTKGVAATLVHILVDRGLLDYEDRVSQHWPEFAQAGKEKITVRQVLAHQSGLYHIRQMIDHADRMLDWDYMIRAIEKSAPMHEPGARTGYHGLTFGFLVGEIARRVSGKPFSQLVQDEIVWPLGLDGLYVGAPPEVLDRAAELIWPPRSLLGRTVGLVPIGGRRSAGWVLGNAAALVEGVLSAAGVQIDLPSMLDALAPRGIRSFDFGSEETLQVAIPAANGLFTARSLARMYAALAGGGQIDGVRLLSSETLERATEPQTEAPGRVVIPFDMRWRLGYHGIATTRGFLKHAFGHFGFGGSGGWAGPSGGLAAAMIGNSGMGTPFGDLRIARLSGAVVASADRRPEAPVARSPGPE
jgi:CubicO group peptidase (beta-lactamase class C family)